MPRKTPTATETFSGLPEAGLQFLVELTENNDREWFKENQARYEETVREPARSLIRALFPRLAKISKHFVVSDKKVGGSMLRPQRDTRFAKDKTPYKTNVGIYFKHEASKDIHAPGLYIHFDPAEAFFGVGIWHPDRDTLERIRKAIDAKPKAWLKVRDDATFRAHFEISGDSLKRPPKGYDAEHPLLEDLKRKDHLAVCKVPFVDLLSPDLPQLVEARMASAKPYLKFLCQALELPI